MGTFIDYIGSLLIAGVITIIVFSLNASMTQTAYTRTNEQISQDAATNMMQILQSDFYKAGYRILSGQQITVAESLRFSFLADLNNVGTSTTIAYAVGTPSQLTVTSNINDRPLFRTLNSNPSVNIIQGMRNCYFAYYDTGGYKMNYSSLDSAHRAMIRGIAVTVTVEPSNPNDTTYIPVKMSKTIWPKNLGAW
jgi:hypothetical protein